MVGFRDSVGFRDKVGFSEEVGLTRAVKVAVGKTVAVGSGRSGKVEKPVLDGTGVSKTAVMLARRFAYSVGSIPSSSKISLRILKPTCGKKTAVRLLV